jgi:hypothetical protein
MSTAVDFQLNSRANVGDDALTELDVLVGFDDDLAGEATRIGNRIRGLPTGIHPPKCRIKQR